MRDGKKKTGESALVKADGTGRQPERWIFLCILGILAVSGVFAVSFAKDFGAGVGTAAGKFAGTVKGSFEGITQGLASGYEAGAQQGLSAEDTNVEISEITAMGKLDVLAAEDQIVNDFEEGRDYKALFVYKTQAVFSVDLGQAEITEEDSAVTITLPGPEVDFIIDENESEKMAEWQKYFWSGNTEAGYIGYMNSMAQIKEKAAEEMRKNDYLMRQAEESARKQVEALARSICVEDKQITVRFKEEEK